MRITLTFLFLCMLFATLGQTSGQLAFMDSLYAAENLEGTFYLVKAKKKKVKETWTYSQERVKEPVIPASTFKIPNTIIALETGIMKSENDTLHWDGTVRSIAAWNKDQSLKEAYKNSTVWFYQELARRIDSANYISWLEKLDYGNQQIGGGIDQFWLTGDLKISAIQQTDFLRKLTAHSFEISDSTYASMKRIMLERSSVSYRLYSKTGWADLANQVDLGWYVGYIETGKFTYYFAHRVKAPTGNPEFGPLRKQIAFRIILELTGLDVSQ